MSEPAAPSARAPDLQVVRGALAVVFWGAVVVVFDVTFGGVAPVPIDVVNDTIGYALITWGLIRLRAQPGPAPFRTAATVGMVFVAVSLLWSIVVQIDPRVGATIVGALMSVPGLVAGVAFTAAMLGFCRAHGIETSARYWEQSLRLALVMWGSLVVLDLIFVGVFEQARFGRWPPRPEWIGILIAVTVVLALVPALFVASSILRTRRELGGATEPPASRPELVIGVAIIAALAIVVVVMTFVLEPGRRSRRRGPPFRPNAAPVAATVVTMPSDAGPLQGAGDRSRLGEAG